jgi:inner membrane protein
MEPITHLMTGACLARAGFNRKAAYATVSMAIAAELPDIDSVWSVDGPVAVFQHHRGITHTFVAIPFEAAAVVGVAWLFHRWMMRCTKRVATSAPVRWGLLYGFVMVALLSHIFLDWTNNYGVRPFFPFNPRWYAGSFVFIFEPVIFLLLLIALIGSEVGERRAQFRGRGWAIFALAAIACLWTLRWFEHDAAVTAASTASYGPQSLGAEVLRVTASPYPGNPFRWHTVAETPQFYQRAVVDSQSGRVVTDATQDLFYKPASTPATEAAKRSWLGRTYLDWSSWPLVTEIGPAAVPESVPKSAPGSAPGSPDATAVRFVDLRFAYDTLMVEGRTKPPLAGTVYVDTSGQIAAMELGGRLQR